MGSKKYRPALYELLDRGNLKPDKKGVIRTPKWFYAGSREGESKEDSGVEQAKPSVQVGDVDGPIGRKLQFKGQWARRAVEVVSRNRFEISASRWVLLLVGVGLLLSHLVVFKMGQQSGSQTTGVETFAADSEGGSPALKDIQKAEIRPDVLQGGGLSSGSRGIRGETVSRASVKSEPTIKRKVESKNEPAEVIAAVSVGGQVLILCGHSSERELRPVQSHFSKQNFGTAIGRFGGRYVLYSLQAFENKTDRGAMELKQRAGAIGRTYNSSKQSGALGFDEETFKGAFPVNLESIQKF